MAASSKGNRFIHTPAITIILEAVIIAVTEEVPRVLTVQQGHAGGARMAALPSGLLDAEKDATLEKALRAWVTRQTGLGVGYVEQLYTFGDRSRDPRAASSQEQRHISVAYLALTRETEPAESYPAEWQNIYQFLPWEDWREGRPTIIDGKILPGLKAWLEGKVPESRRAAQRERVDLCFSRAGGHWDYERCLDRYRKRGRYPLNGFPGRSGTGRFFSSPLDDEYVWAAMHHVESIPVRAGMVGKAEDCPWPSANGHCGLGSDSVLTVKDE